MAGHKAARKRLHPKATLEAGECQDNPRAVKSRSSGAVRTGRPDEKALRIGQVRRSVPDAVRQVRGRDGPGRCRHLLTGCCEGLHERSADVAGGPRYYDHEQLPCWFSVVDGARAGEYAAER